MEISKFYYSIIGARMKKLGGSWDALGQRYHSSSLSLIDKERAISFDANNEGGS